MRVVRLNDPERLVRSVVQVSNHFVQGHPCCQGLLRGVFQLVQLGEVVAEITVGLWCKLHYLVCLGQVREVSARAASAFQRELQPPPSCCKFGDTETGILRVMISKTYPIEVLASIKERSVATAQVKMGKYDLWHGRHLDYGEILILIAAEASEGSLSWELGA